MIAMHTEIGAQSSSELARVTPRSPASATPLGSFGPATLVLASTPAGTGSRSLYTATDRPLSGNVELSMTGRCSMPSTLGCCTPDDNLQSPMTSQNQQRFRLRPATVVGHPFWPNSVFHPNNKALLALSHNQKMVDQVRSKGMQTHDYHKCV